MKAGKHNKKSDFTVMIMEDGTKLTTVDRNVKGMQMCGFGASSQRLMLPFHTCRCSCSSHKSSHKRRILQQEEPGTTRLGIPQTAFCRSAHMTHELHMLTRRHRLHDLKTREGRLSEEQITCILTKATEILKKEATVVDVDAPITGICEKSDACSPSSNTTSSSSLRRYPRAVLRSDEVV